ncbi:MAG: pyruvate formate lyase family protein [Candidatus Helarchaeota archaeon]
MTSIIVTSSKLHPNNRIHKNRLLKSPIWLCMERAKFYTESYRETEGEHPAIRAAKALKKVFEKMTIKIYNEEKLVGNRASHFVAPPFAPERGDLNYVLKYLLPDLKKFGYRISKEDEKLLFKEILPYWEGKTVRDLKVKKFEAAGLSSQLNLSLREVLHKLRAFDLKTFITRIKREDPSIYTKKGFKARIKRFARILKILIQFTQMLDAIKSGSADNVKGRIRCIDTQAHIVVGHENVLKFGFKGLKEKALLRLKSAKNEDEINFLKSVEIVCDAIKNFSERFAKLAEEKAELEKNPSRRTELLKIARICNKVPWNPPNTFYEALQSLWLTQNAIIISYGAGSGITPGRVDQLLYPYYKHDIETGLLTRDEALRLIEEFIIKINNNVVIWPNIMGVNLNHLGSDIENITLGGVDKNGNDAVNDLTYLFIEAIKNTKLATSVSFRISKKSPKEYIQKIIELHKYTNGPAFFNDEIAIKTLVRDGWSYWGLKNLFSYYSRFDI